MPITIQVQMNQICCSHVMFSACDEQETVVNPLCGVCAALEPATLKVYGVSECLVLEINHTFNVDNYSTMESEFSRNTGPSAFQLQQSMLKSNK